MAGTRRERRLRWWERPLEAAAASRAGARFFVTIGNRVDRVLLPVTRGRLSVGLGQPVALLRTVGARSGKVRGTPLLYLEDGERIVFVASNGGSPRHPAWYHNVRAHPEVTVVARGEERGYLAREAAGEERERLWERVNDLYRGYDVYQERAGSRRIPLVVLEPRGDGQPSADRRPA